MSLPVKFVLSILLALVIAPCVHAHGNEKHAEKVSTPVAEATVAPVGEARSDVPANGDRLEPRPSVDASHLASNLHPALVHFPIALILAAAVAQLVAMVRGSGQLEDAARVMAIIGGITSAVAALFGWVHTGAWLGGDQTMQIHRWLGTGLGLAGLAIAWIGWTAGPRRAAMSTLLAVTALALIGQAYLGGEISHGAGHLWK